MVLAKLSIACGIASVCFGILFFIPLAGIVTGISALARRTDSPVRAALGLTMSITFGLLWGGIVFAVLYAFGQADSTVPVA